MTAASIDRFSPDTTSDEACTYILSEHIRRLTLLSPERKRLVVDRLVRGEGPPPLWGANFEEID